MIDSFSASLKQIGIDVVLEYILSSFFVIVSLAF